MEFKAVCSEPEMQSSEEKARLDDQGGLMHFKGYTTSGECSLDWTSFV